MTIKRPLISMAIASLLVGAGTPAVALEPIGSPIASPRPTCPNPYGGGACLGPLAPGAYRTTVFRTPFTFTVPDGWSNGEDLPGNFLLVPPGGTLEGVDAGTSDYIGIYKGVGVGRSEGTACDFPRPGVLPDAASMAAALQTFPGIIASEALPVEVGGLTGFVIDLTYDTTSDAGCQPPDLPGPIRAFLVGTGPAHLHHVVAPGILTRLYLLDLPTRVLPMSNIAIEISDVETSPGSADDHAAIIDSLEFPSDPAVTTP